MYHSLLERATQATAAADTTLHNSQLVSSPMQLTVSRPNITEGHSRTVCRPFSPICIGSECRVVPGHIVTTASSAWKMPTSWRRPQSKTSPNSDHSNCSSSSSTSALHSSFLHFAFLCPLVTALEEWICISFTYNKQSHCFILFLCMAACWMLIETRAGRHCRYGYLITHGCTYI